MIATVAGALVIISACAAGEPLTGEGGGRVALVDASADSSPAPTATANGSASGLDAGDDLAPIFYLDAAAGDSGMGTVTDAEACARSGAVAEPVPAVIEIVLDTSGSMRWVASEERDPLAGEQSKLEVTRDALIQAIDAMPDESSVGLFIYPGREDDVQGDCLASDTSIALEPLSPGHRDQLRATLSQTVAEGGTPTYDAYVQALAELESTTLSGDKYIVLITDGVPTYALGCNGNGTDPVALDALESDVQDALGRKIRTFVVGSPGSEPARDALSGVASAGGTAQPGCARSGPNYCHFDMTESTDFSASLNAALASIASQTLSCSYEIPDPPGGEELDPERVNVRFTDGTSGSETILQAASPEECSAGWREGWRYSDDGTRVVLCEPTCEQVRARLDGKVEILFGCATKVAPIR